MTTNRQKTAVHFCEQWLSIKFDGDINDFKQVSNFLQENLDNAKMLFTEAKSEYETWLWEKGY